MKQRKFKFEYSYLHVDEEYLNDLGSKGWRITSVFPAGEGVMIVLEKEICTITSLLNKIKHIFFG